MTKDGIEISLSDVEIKKDETQTGCISFFSSKSSVPVVVMKPGGIIEWNGRVVESDDDFKAAMMQLHATFYGMSGNRYVPDHSETEYRFDLARRLREEADQIDNRVDDKLLRDAADALEGK